MYTIYIIKNIINSKWYVGQTKQALKTRWRGHVEAALSGKGSLLHNAMRKHGAECFWIEPVMTCATSAEADALEQESIEFLSADERRHGYNVAPGGGRILCEYAARSLWARRAYEVQSTQEDIDRLKAEYRARSIKVWGDKTLAERSEVLRKTTAAQAPEQRSVKVRTWQALRTPEERSTTVRKANAKLTPEERSEVKRKMWERKTPEQRSEVLRKANAALTPEQHRERMRKANASRTPEMVKAAHEKRLKNIGPEARRAAARKTWETRRRKIAAGLEESPSERMRRNAKKWAQENPERARANALNASQCATRKRREQVAAYPLEI
ncbi:GIY-YIG nuclease family protein [Methylocystis sp.]|uniref:GIY-YIG nuclease family protein n=1 Tax=Methylocystis sp. TaxID=1911079 RepID=UPI003DA5F18D